MDAMALTAGERAELAAKIPSGKYDGSVASRARIVLLWDEGVLRAEIAAIMDTSVVTVGKWIGRYCLVIERTLLVSHRDDPADLYR